MVTVVVRGRIPGREGLGEIQLDVAPGLTARDLIASAVATQLSDEGQDWTNYARLYLTDQEITAMAAEGVVRVLPRNRPPRPSVDLAVERALKSFERRRFVMFVGTTQVSGLDDNLALRDGDRVVFVRLTALAGG